MLSTARGEFGHYGDRDDETDASTTPPADRVTTTSHHVEVLWDDTPDPDGNADRTKWRLQITDHDAATPTALYGDAHRWTGTGWWAVRQYTPARSRTRYSTTSRTCSVSHGAFSAPTNESSAHPIYRRGYDALATALSRVADTAG